MIEAIKIISKCTGITNKIDPKRLTVSELSESQDIDVDDSGQVMSRLGQAIFPESGLTNVPSHSLFCDGGDAFVHQDRTRDAALFKINTDLTLTVLWAGLIKGAYASFVQQGERTFYTTGFQNGVIEAGLRSSWPSNTYYGPDTLKEFSPAPIGHLLCKFNNRIGVAIDEGIKFVIYFSEPHKPGLFRLAKYYFLFASHIRMAVEVTGGLWVSDSEKTGFISNAETWDGHRFIKKSQYPAHEWSLNCRLVNLSKSQWEVPGLSAVWSSDEGLCIGTPDGQLIVTTKEKLLYPTGASGATVVDNLNVINSVY
jgi:hypothetical protein